jgi:surface protein
MFNNTGNNSTDFTLDLSNFDTSKVTNMSYMFMNAGNNSTDFTLNVSNFDTSNVTNMTYMFSYTGKKSTNFTLDLSNFDTSNVTNMSSMFLEMGLNSTKLNTSITIRNPNTTSYSFMFRYVATKEGSQVTVNYTSETSALVDKMIATKSSGANVVKGKCIDCELFSFTVGATNGTTYQAEEGMTWREWINSPYNTGDLFIGTCNCNDLCAIDPEGNRITNGQGDVVVDLPFNLVSPDMLIPQDDVEIYLVDYFDICIDEEAGFASPQD